jgi:SAM-dependent methyltransferase
MSLLIAKHWSAENDRSPEFRYLNGVLQAEARRIFGDVALVMWRIGEPEPIINDSHYVLLLGDANLWFTTGTLTRLKSAIDDGAPAAAPAPVSAGMTSDAPLYTPRDFEQLEARAITDRNAAASQLPISLWSGQALSAAIGEMPLSRLLTEPRALPPGSRLDAGVFLPFTDYYGEVRADLLPHLPERADDVLEIGCGRGLTGALIQERLGCRVTGVELHPGIAAEARGRLSSVIVGDIESLAVDGRYDAIVASELIEHVADPDAVLLKLKALLAPGGRIVLSVPNVGHYSIVEDLLAGRWDYVPIGLLCVTHLRFFTRRTLEDTAARLGFACTIHPQSGELPERFSALPPIFESDADSLRAKGFYVVLEPLPAAH